jgi:hypothetical protein
MSVFNRIIEEVIAMEVGTIQEFENYVLDLDGSYIVLKHLFTTSGHLKGYIEIVEETPATIKIKRIARISN